MKKIVWLAVLATAVFIYGIGVGRFRWPPFEIIQAALRLAVRPAMLPPKSINYYSTRTSLFNVLQGSADVVMLGDSLTEFGSWTELLPGINVINRGIAGDTAPGVSARMEEVVRRQPKIVFLLIGTNDAQTLSQDEFVESATNIVDTFRRVGIEIVVQSVPFVGEQLRQINQKIEAFNVALEEMCTKREVPFLNLNHTLAPKGVLEPRFTTDGIHLSAVAYVVWSEQIKAYLAGVL